MQSNKLHCPRGLEIWRQVFNHSEEFYSATFLQILTYPAPLILLAGFGEEFGVGDRYSAEW